MPADAPLRHDTASVPARPPRLRTPTHLTDEQAGEVAAAVNRCAATTVALWLKTKNYHWHLSGPHFRDYHLLLDEQAAELLATVDPLAERVRKIGRTTLHSVGHVARLQRIDDDERPAPAAHDMLHVLAEDNETLTRELLAAHAVCDEYGDVATASLIEDYVDQAERRTWFLFEATRGA